MALAPRLDLRQIQSLVMTPQLQQAIKLLQLSNLELGDYVERELEQNPLLEREDSDDNDNRVSEKSETQDSGEFQTDGDAGSDSDVGFEDAPEPPDSRDLIENSSHNLDNDAGPDADYENVWSGDSVSDTVPISEADTLHWQVRGAGGFDLDDPDLENAPAGEISLRDHLQEQINVDIADPVNRMIAVHMLDALDEAGYLITGLEEFAESLGCSKKRVEETLAVVQTFDPPGIFARTLSECLAIQLRERDRYDPAMRALVENLDLLAKREFKQLRRLCEVDSEDIAEMINEIKALNPKPALAFDYTVSQPVIPDVMIRRMAKGGWAIDLNSQTLPRVLVNNQYYTRLASGATRDKDKEYISECYQSANWLVRALHQRAQTILKVATEIVRQQERFLERGVEYLKPLVLRDIAQTLGIHESTVSRVTNNKYMATPRGIYELKYFFTFAVGENRNGEAASAEAIRHRIKSLIAEESIDNVLSDDKIVNILKNKGVEVARRTVAKYRESLHIPSSVQRRREKALHL
jgi:RNA polymerase sigma-54 factor